MEELFILRGKRLGEAVEYLRSTKRIRTQKELADKVGCSANQISRAIAGSRKDMTSKLLGRINRYFDEIFNEEYILEGEGTLLKEPVKTEKLANDEGSGFEALYKKALERIIELERENAVLLFQLSQYTDIEKEKKTV